MPRASTKSKWTAARKAALEKTLRLIPGYDPWALAGDSWLDHEAADRAIQFFPTCLKHVEGAMAGKPFALELWEQAIIGNLFGWKRKDDKGRIVRRYRECLLYIGRKNGKTPLAAGICLYVLFLDGEAGAQIYGAAADSEQAGFLYRQARGMVERNPDLLARAVIYGGDNHRAIVLRGDSNSVYRVISAEAGTKHGANPHLILFDELHAQKNRELYDVFTSSMSSENRAQPLLIYMTTADFDRPSVCNDVHERALAVRDNKGDAAKPGFDSAFLPVIYEVPTADDWSDESNWRKANPNLGVSVSLDALRRAFQIAKENPVEENKFRRLNLNQVTGQDVRIIPMDAWDACGMEPIDLEALKGRPCYGGLDMASNKDLASFALVFPGDGADDPYTVLSWSWCPAARVKVRAEQRIPYDIWIKQGFLEATEGNDISYAAIEERIRSLAAIYELREIGYDGWNTGQMAQNLISAGLAVVKILASFNLLNPPTKELLRRIVSRRIRHEGSPVVRWAASNVAPKFEGKEQPTGDLEDLLGKVRIMPSKQNSADKIDPITAIVLAIGRVIANPDDVGRSVYETRGLEFV
jgi:phage terminase large subunit-like protein